MRRRACAAPSGCRAAGFLRRAARRSRLRAAVAATSRRTGDLRLSSCAPRSTTGMTCCDCTGRATPRRPQVPGQIQALFGDRVDDRLGSAGSGRLPRSGGAAGVGACAEQDVDRGELLPGQVIVVDAELFLQLTHRASNDSSGSERRPRTWASAGAREMLRGWAMQRWLGAGGVGDRRGGAVEVLRDGAASGAGRSRWRCPCERASSTAGRGDPAARLGLVAIPPSDEEERRPGPGARQCLEDGPACLWVGLLSKVSRTLVCGRAGAARRAWLRRRARPRQRAGSDYAAADARRGGSAGRTRHAAIPADADALAAANSPRMARLRRARGVRGVGAGAARRSPRAARVPAALYRRRRERGPSAR